MLGYDNLHATAEHHVRTSGMGLRTIPKELERQLSIVDNDKSLAQYRYGRDLSIKFLVLQPVVAFQHTGFRQVIHIAEQWYSFGTWRQWATCPI
jgi:hypothetical protein